MTARRLVSLRQAGEQRTWATERYLRRLIAERRIPFHKIGGKVLVDLGDLDAYAEAGRIEPARKGLRLVAGDARLPAELAGVARPRRRA